VNSDEIEISGNGFRYSAIVGRGLIAHVGELARRAVDRSQCVIIADQTSAGLFGDRVGRSLASQDFSSQLITIPDGEKSKSLTQVEEICDEMINAGFDRSSFVIGLGGGVVGDISGFVAAIFQRGIPHLQIPTTLLAMVDSSIGGKTGVNLEAGKNLVGAIHHPALIICDVDALKSLPPQQMRQGYAEIIKHAIIRDAEMFDFLSSQASSRDPEDVTFKCPPQHPSSDARDNEMVDLIGRNIAIKARIVSKDDRETSGERALLNFGHTVGHGIERATDFQIPHGDCISMGMVAACEISMKRAGFPSKQRGEIVELLKKFQLPTRLPANVDRGKIIDAIAHDKKFIAGKIRFVLTPIIGDAHISSDVTMDDIRAAIAAL